LKFPPEDIVFDLNVLAIGTGMEEHVNYGVDSINAVKTIKEQCPYVKLGGGMSNLSIGVRGMTKIRESIHSIFLHHAILESDIDVGIVNAYEMLTIDGVEPESLEACEDLVFNRNEELIERMLKF
jgi:5-methyltetrahydrofolate--homocysteine methyltransferase